MGTGPTIFCVKAQGVSENQQQLLIAALKMEEKIQVQVINTNYVSTTKEICEKLLKKGSLKLAGNMIKFLPDDLVVACEWEEKEDPKNMEDALTKADGLKPFMTQIVGDKLWIRFPKLGDVKKLVAQIIKIKNIEWKFYNPWTDPVAKSLIDPKKQASKAKQTSVTNQPQAAKKQTFSSMTNKLKT
jgi:hypothetical protein